MTRHHHIEADKANDGNSSNVERIEVRSRWGDVVLIVGKWALCTACLLAVLGIVGFVLGAT